MGLFDAYSGVKKNGYQLYKSNCILIYNELVQKTWDSIYTYFSEEPNELNLVLYLGGNGITASYTKYYCSKSSYSQIEQLLKPVWKELKKTIYIC